MRNPSVVSQLCRHRWVPTVVVLLGTVTGLPVQPRLAAGENSALLVAVGDYNPTQLDKLRFTRNDILEFHEVLQQAGFRKENLVLMHDDPRKPAAPRFIPDAARIRKELALLLAGREADDMVIIAFAGHGVQFRGEKQSWFCPLDADLDNRATLISLSEVYQALERCRARRKLLLVDACRNDPRTPVSRGRKTVDLESVTRPQSEPVPEGIVAFFSCAPGQQSYEWPELKHGLFFHHLLDVWRNGPRGDAPELTLADLVEQTRKRTEAFARNTLQAAQTPEFKGEYSGTWVLQRYDDKTSTNSIGMKLVRIPAGEFLMGSPHSDRRAHEPEKPQHRVRLTRPFLMGMYEVTRGQFARFSRDAQYRTDAEIDGNVAGGWSESKQALEYHVAGYNWRTTGFPQTDDHPVVNVTWNDAVAFCDWLSRKEGKIYRLPTEAEWEYACRAGTTTAFHHGDDVEGLTKVANVADRSAVRIVKNVDLLDSSDGFAFTAPVGSLAPNRFGLYDMHGNVFEWCRDRFDAKYYEEFADQTAVDPKGPPWESFGFCEEGRSHRPRRIAAPRAGRAGTRPGGTLRSASASSGCRRRNNSGSLRSRGGQSARCLCGRVVPDHLRSDSSRQQSEPATY